MYGLCFRDKTVTCKGHIEEYEPTMNHFFSLRPHLFGLFFDYMILLEKLELLPSNSKLYNCTVCLMGNY